jgi:hypothetical protein
MENSAESLGVNVTPKSMVFQTCHTTSHKHRLNKQNLSARILEVEHNLFGALSKESYHENKVGIPKRNTS